MHPQNGFKVGDSTHSCTQTLWIYSKPVIGSNEGNERVPVFFVDSEGWNNEHNKNQDYFKKLMVIVWMTSSYYKFNLD
jgi:hypothetical protein